MKLIVVLSLLVLSLPREGATTHLETCDCHEIKDIVNATVQEAITGLEEKLNILISKQNEETSTELESTFSAALMKALEPIQLQLDYHLPPPSYGLTKDTPIQSCKELGSNSKSGYYWVQATEDSTPVRVYCNMSLSCGGITGGWMKVADLDMRNTSHSCPSGFNYVSSPKRLCDITATDIYTGPCVGKDYSVHGLQYDHVCGRIIGYQYRVPLAYQRNSESRTRHYNDIDQPYMFGVSLTHGRVNHRSHIWTFVGSSDESTREPNLKCPCINTAITSQNPPSFMRNDYFCDTALSQDYTRTSTYRNELIDTSDPLWDGEGCGPTNSCCDFPSSSVKPPWFYRNLPQATTNDIEMRLCRPGNVGSTPIEIVELYVQ